MARELQILLIEDSPADARLIARGLRETVPSHRLLTLSDGHRALDYFQRLLDPATPPDFIPDLVLLDLNLPGLDGVQILETLKADPVLRVLPVVVLTTSERDEDVRRSYQAGANSYIRKPDEYQAYAGLMSLLRSYWAEAVLRPPLH